MTQHVATGGVKDGLHVAMCTCGWAQRAHGRVDAQERAYAHQREAMKQERRKL